jgi:hypothetical protein
MKQPKGQFTKGLWEMTKLISVLTFCFFILTLVGGCTVTPEMRHAREARIAEHYDKYFALKEVCERNGNFIYVKWFGGIPMSCRHNKDCPPRTYDQYYCVSSIRINP